MNTVPLHHYVSSGELQLDQFQDSEATTRFIRMFIRAQDERSVESSVPSLVRCKDRGGLVKPSKCVIKTCTETGKCFKRIAKTVAVPTHPRAMQAVVSAVMPSIIGSTFGCLNVHMFDSEPFNNHVVLMQKSIIQCYCKIRIHHLIKTHNMQSTDRKVRKTLSKLVLFHHQ